MLINALNRHNLGNPGDNSMIVFLVVNKTSIILLLVLHRLPKCDVTHPPPRGQRFLSGAGDHPLPSYYTGPGGSGADNSPGGS